MENQKAPEGLHLSNGERVYRVVEWVPVILTGPEWTCKLAKNPLKVK